MNGKALDVLLSQTFSDVVFCTVENCMLAIDASAGMSRLWIEECLLHGGEPINMAGRYAVMESVVLRDEWNSWRSLLCSGF